jgi:hypothetical protein
MLGRGEGVDPCSRAEARGCAPPGACAVRAHPGMLLALYSNDQEYFNILLDNGEKYMWNGR